MAALRPARISFYVDADLLGLAKVLMAVRNDVTYPGDPGGVSADHRFRPACPVTAPETKDDVWLPIVASEGWIAITKDSAIGRTARLRVIANQHGSRLVAIASQQKMRKWDQLVVLTAAWQHIEALKDVPGPWMYRANRSGRLTRVVGIGRAPGGS